MVNVFNLLFSLTNIADTVAVITQDGRMIVVRILNVDVEQIPLFFYFFYYYYYYYLLLLIYLTSVVICSNARVAC